MSRYASYSNDLQRNFNVGSSFFDRLKCLIDQHDGEQRFHQMRFPIQILKKVTIKPDFKDPKDSEDSNNSKNSKNSKNSQDSPQIEQRNDSIKIFASDLARKVMEKAFRSFQENKLSQSKMEHFFCNNFLANIIRYAKANNLSSKDFQIMDQHLKQFVFPFLKQRYPQSQAKSINRKFQSIITPVDNSDSNLNDLIYQSGVKFEYKKSEDYTPQIMNFINYIISVTRKEIEVEPIKQNVEESKLGNIKYVEEPKIGNIKNVEESKFGNIKNVEEPKLGNIKYVEEPKIGNIKNVEESKLGNIKNVEGPKIGNIKNVEESKFGNIKNVEGPKIGNIKYVEEPKIDNIKYVEEPKIDNIRQKRTLSDAFYNDMQKFFKKVQDQDWMRKKREQQKDFFFNRKTNQPTKQKFDEKFIYGLLLSIIDYKDPNKPKQGTNENNLHQTKSYIDSMREAERQKYIKDVRQYTKYQIGQKISNNVKVFNKNQIKDQKLVINDNGLLRVLTKWCEQLQKCYNQANIYTREQRFRMANGQQRYTNKKHRKQLYEQIKQQFKKCQQFKKQIKQNIYDNQQKMIEDGRFAKAYRLFTSEDEGSVGYFTAVMKMANENYLISYINTLINGILKAQQRLKSKYSKKQHYKVAVNLLSFKISDLLRCKCSSKQDQIIALYRQLLYKCQHQKDTYELVRVKNRLKEGTKDILINFRYRKQILVQMQLSIDQDKSRFITCSDKANHFIYQLQRAIFGPISEICNVYVKNDPRAEFFKKKFFSVKNNSKVTDQKKNENYCQHNKTDPTTLPCWCYKCKNFSASLNIPQKHSKCANLECKKVLCSSCQAQNKYKDIKSDTKIENDNKKQQNLTFSGIINKVQVYDKQQEKKKKKQNLQIKQQINIIDLERKKLVERTLLIVYYNSRLMIFQYHVVENKDNDKITKKQQVSFMGEAKNQKQFDNILSKKIVKKCNNRQLNDKQKSQLEMLLINQIIRVQVQNAKSKQKKYFVVQQTKIDPKIFVRQVQVFHQPSSQRASTSNIKTKKQEAKQVLNCVRQINMNNNHIQQIKQLVKVFPQAQIVLLHKNKINSLEEVSKWFRVKQLNLEGNNISKIPGQISKLQSLEFLIITNNKFTQFPVQILQCISLKKLNFKQNYIETIPKEITKLSNLQFLRLTANCIKVVPDQISQLKKLKQLDLSQNFIQKIPDKLNDLVSLEEINLQYNKLMELPDQLFLDMSCIKKIDMSNNKIREMPSSLKNKNKLQRLDFQSNKLTKIPKLIFELQSIQQIRLSNNEIQQYTGDIKLNINEKNQQITSDNSAFKNSKLKILLIKKNQKVPQFINAIQSLQKLQLSQVNFNLINLKNLNNLKSLSLEDMKLTQFPHNLFTLTNNLESISLDKNFISGLTDKMKKFKNSLKQLYLSDNLLKKIPPQIYQLRNLQNLGLSRNPFDQIDNLQLQLIAKKLTNLQKLKLLQIKFKSNYQTILSQIVKGEHFRQLYINQSNEIFMVSNKRLKIITKQIQQGPKIKLTDKKKSDQRKQLLQKQKTTIEENTIKQQK